jgi:hypothetical protein
MWDLIEELVRRFYRGAIWDFEDPEGPPMKEFES